MELRPADLGEAWQVALVRQRAGVSLDAPAPAPRLGRLGRRWAKRADLPEELAARTLPLTRAHTTNATGMTVAGLGWVPLLCVSIAAAGESGAMLVASGASAVWLGWLGTVAAPARAVRALHHRPLHEWEVHRLREKLADYHGLRGDAAGPDVWSQISDRLRELFRRSATHEAPEPMGAGVLEDDFWALVGDVLRTDLHTADAEAELRRTLRLLGEAVAALPLPPGAGMASEGDAEDLLADAEMLVARARRENDRVIAESLLRQAEAKAAQAQAVKDALLLTRRTRILREELRAQVAATRAALPSLSRAAGAAAASHATPALGRVAASVRAVAREAASVTAAREELAEALGVGAAWSPSDTPEEAATTPGRSRWNASTDEDARHIRLGR